MLQAAKKTVKAALQGVKSIELAPHSDYRKNVSIARDISERSWEATGNQLWGAIRSLETDYAKK